ncbi:siderophore-interacting protein [Agromyces sp. LHK192]|uniref:siderophore-interacting protein n=1 Tax=Agromyces sp. LHK192 TaxID=2498704 RepID=UPI001F0BEC39|nr:siderophore-interacting protein [Agromyces sp. LHK192]
MSTSVANRIHRLEVVETQRLTPGMLRIVFGGDGVAQFESTGVGDEYFRLFLPLEGQDVPNLPNATEDGYWEFPDGVEPSEVRTYTVRGWDASAGLLTVDFVVHEGGVAAAWALRAKVGDVIGANSPRGLYEPADGITWQLLVADATGLPAALRLAESAPEGVRTRVVIEVADDRDEQRPALPAHVDLAWVHGGNGHGPTRIEEIVRAADFPDEPGYVWVAGETKATRGVRKHLRHELGLPANAYKVVGYWTEKAEAWRDAYDALPEDVLARLQAMWSEDRDEEEITDEYEATLEAHGL